MKDLLILVLSGLKLAIMLFVCLTGGLIITLGVFALLILDRVVVELIIKRQAELAEESHEV